jgi:hypothetical protein
MFGIEVLGIIRLLENNARKNMEFKKDTHTGTRGHT